MESVEHYTEKRWGLGADAGLREPIDQLAMANSVRWHGHVLRREDRHLLRRV